MGLFAWLGGLLDQLVEWLGRVVAAFLEALVWALQKIWQTAVVSVLIAAFGFVASLYVIFYAGAMLGETIMEIWDPRYADSKPSQVFSIEQAPQISPLPKYRSETKTIKLQNSY
ncbi:MULTISPECIES: hypothetical protein [unclassified Microcoleus]|jgi:hypothetical protein|uniref:hypothetical protein n=1 Tax=unclassified Microcoleus TaxID=2642155 RepID=UPI001DA2D6EA|nr:MULTISPECIES: hypothetical protein [unclassified Microcoleus]MCC3442624.1 hypothetical protein [Microcoleus sp. PH2017_03_ELD_O_A]MCC3502869.1 hypothetical protein [Microcoleus sp. PH2017_19_SFW_U_A]TAE14771.1 MAG: hypothetical protein EAZ94_06245 [Oscillatoriales cyanobacterium]MCC3410863.1 hypothetical protein [Microcoleus sp. PH2017_02_FOX_O_A]MCC3471028.1 hypothetical protein [Microcoleus sp. PH2017_13_LAR_U_A]